MLALAWVISLIATTLLGYYLRQIADALKKLQTNVVEKMDKPKEEPRKSVVLDPTDITQRTLQEHAELMRKINPGSRE